MPLSNSRGDEGLNNLKLVKTVRLSNNKRSDLNTAKLKMDNGSWQTSQKVKGQKVRRN
jgi:hypothetical protein